MRKLAFVLCVLLPHSLFAAVDSRKVIEDAVATYNKADSIEKLSASYAKTLNDADRSTLSAYLKNYQTSKPAPAKFINGGIRFQDGPDIVDMKIKDARNSLIIIRGKEVDLNSEIPLVKRLARLEEAMADKAANSRFDFALFPQAHAGIGVAALIVAGGIFVTANARDYYYREWLGDTDTKLTKVLNKCSMLSEKERHLELGDGVTDAVKRRQEALQNQLCHGGRVAGKKVITFQEITIMDHWQATFDSTCDKAKFLGECYKRLFIHSARLDPKDVEEMKTGLDSIEIDDYYRQELALPPAPKAMSSH